MTDPNQPSDLPNPARPQAEGIDEPAKPMADRDGRTPDDAASEQPGMPPVAHGDADDAADLGDPDARS